MCAAGQVTVDGRTSLKYMLNNNETTNETNIFNQINDTDLQLIVFYTQLYTIVTPVVFSTVVLFGILGNVLVCYVILSKKKLRTVTNLLLLNLSFADISFLLVCGGFTVLHYALAVWPFGDILCRITQYLLYVTCYVTMYTLVAVSLARCITIIYGQTVFLIRSQKNIIKLCVAIWATFLLAKIPILIVHGVSHNPVTNRTECIISGRREAQNLFASFFFFAYALPLLFICTLYISALCHLRGKKNLLQMKNNNTVRSSEHRTSHVTKVVMVVVLVFAICWLPLHIHLLVAYYATIPNTPVYHIFLLVWHCLTYTNSLLNPIIYNVFSKDFRSGFMEVICRRKPEVNV